MLVGRRRESAVLDRLLGDVRDGRSSVLVVHGEPGVGKTALLEYLIASASGFRVARTVGVESELKLAFAALQHLCASMLDQLDGLPGPQREALETAFGLSAGDSPERFLVGLASLSLLSAAAEKRPLLCVVDDAQWLDRASGQALAFVARRLLTDPVALVFATRERSDELAGLPELNVQGLEDADARTLLASSIDGPIDDRVRDRIVAETRGNPLALLELPRGLTPAQLAVGFELPVALPLSGRIEESFRRRVEELPVDTQRYLLLASAEALGDSAKILRAAKAVGIDAPAAEPASAAGLLDIDDGVRFRHPLVRSAVYRAASPQERRDVHRALAQATDGELDPDRRAWHLARATAGPDEDVAAELERSAGRAQERGGLVAAAAFLELSAELSADRERQAERLLLAAGADLSTGANARAQALLEQSVGNLVDPAARAQATRMEGAIRFAEGRGGETPGLLLDAATAFRAVDVRLARATYLEALESAMWAGRLTSGPTTTDVAEAARTLPDPGDDATTAELVLTGYTKRLTSGYAEGVEWWRRGCEPRPAEFNHQFYLQWIGMLWNATGELFDFESHSAVGRLRVRLAREQGALAWLPVALSCLAWSERMAGRIDAADGMVAEAIEIASAIGTPSMPGAQELMHLAMLAWRGSEETRPVADAVTAEAVARGQGLAATLAQFTLVSYELGHGRYEDARIAALNVYEEDPLYIGGIVLADLVEAAVRTGDTDAAHSALARLSERAMATETPWALGLLARARALLAPVKRAEPLYEEAVDRLGQAGVTTDVAQARLLYGEWLRRQRRRRDARVQLQAAHDMFQATGAVAFADRAGVELLATGARTRTRVSESRDQLTPQEKQIAQLAADGESNAEIGAQLFISPHTVAYHLRKVFSKLGITSRNQLAGAISGRP